jgi:hypothetical protein
MWHSEEFDDEERIFLSCMNTDDEVDVENE